MKVGDVAWTKLTAEQQDNLVQTDRFFGVTIVDGDAKNGGAFNPNNDGKPSNSTNINAKKNPDGTEKKNWNESFTGEQIINSCQEELINGNQLFKQAKYTEAIPRYRKCWHYAICCPKATKKSMSNEAQVTLIKLGSDGLNNHARCLINQGLYQECLDVISSGHAQHFGENLKLCKVFVVALFNVGKLNECSDYLRKCQKLLREIENKRLADQDYEKGVDLEAQMNFLKKYFDSVREKAVALNWPEMPKGPLSPERPAEANQDNGKHEAPPQMIDEPEITKVKGTWNC